MKSPWTRALVCFGVPFLLIAGTACSRSESSNSSNPAPNPLTSILHGKSCDLRDDEQGIPHVRADSDEMALACLGYVHARDRIWEMDYFRRASQGRRAEILGWDQIKQDFMMRILGLHDRARTVFAGMTPGQQRPLWAYAYGVNQGMEAALKKGSYEFEKLGYRPEPWRPEDSVALALLQSFDQTRKTFTTRITEEKWRNVHGAQQAGLFAADGLPWDEAILKPGEYPRNAAKQDPADRSAASLGSMELAGIQQWLNGLDLDLGMGSNNWVIGPARSATRNAWLANDPHLRLHYPPVWHLAHLQGGRFDAIGAAFAGIPVIVSGANRNASWGLTNAYLNVSSIVIVAEDELKGVAATRPWIWFKFWKFKLPFFFKTFQVTAQRHPVLPLPTPQGKALVLSWAGLDLDSPLLGQSFTALLDVMAADSAEALDGVLQKVNVPTWNFVFADRRGKIGYRAVGHIPRGEQAPAFGIPDRKLVEWENEQSRQPWYSAEEMPHLFNPSRGYIATANNRQWPVDARFHGGRAYQHGFRAYRIEELLKKTPRHSLESLERTQCDVQATDARFLLPGMLRALRLKSTENAATALLGDWDFEASLDCRACALYRRWVDHLKQDLDVNENALYRKCLTPDPEFSLALARGLRAAMGDLDGKDKAWKEVHFARFPHLMGDRWFGEELIPTPGDDHSVNPGTTTWEEGRFIQETGASQRLIVEMSDPPKVWGILPGYNEDREKRSLLDEQGPWKQWTRCRMQRREFPFDWEKNPGIRIAF